MLARSYVHRPLRLLALFVGLPWTLFAQEDPTIPDDVPAFSLERLSIGYSSTFYLVPWTDLNDSFNAVRDAYAYSSTVDLVGGFIERHRGDLSHMLTASYRVAGPFSIHAEAMVTGAKAQFEVRTRSPGPAFNGNSVLTNYEVVNANAFDLSVRGVGLGFSLEISERFSTRLTASAGTAYASLDYDFHHFFDWSSYRYRVTLRDQNTFLSLSAEGSVPLTSAISFNFGVSFRSLRFARLEGDGALTYDDHLYDWDYKAPFHARLAKDGSYYGIDIAGDYRVTGNRYIQRQPWLSTPGPLGGGNPVPMTLYLGGIGIRGGLSYAF